MDEKTAAQVRETISKGGSGFALGLTTADCRKTYETLKARGVEFSEEPTEHEYGIDCGLRDPFGNHLRIVQLATAPEREALVHGVTEQPVPERERAGAREPDRAHVRVIGEVRDKKSGRHHKGSHHAGPMKLDLVMPDEVKPCRQKTGARQIQKSIHAR